MAGNIQNRKRSGGGRGKQHRERIFSRRMQKKLTASFAFVLLCLILLLIRVAAITATRGTKYAKQVLSQQSYDSRSIPARRGEIQDANGITMAKSDRYYNVVLDCYAINEDPDYVEPTVTAVASLFGLDESDIRDIVTSDNTRNSRYQIVRKNVTKEEKDAFEKYQSGADIETELNVDEATMKAQRQARANIQGVWFEETYVRSYPYGNLAANVIGFSNAIDQGVTGVENYYNSLLNGTDGREFGYLSSSSDFERETIEPKHGATVRLTLDMNIQQFVQDEIDAFDDEYGTEDSGGKGAKNIGVVVMDPNTGAVLAMASNHEYDLSDPYDLSDQYSDEELSAKDQDEISDLLYEKWKNFCVSESYEPGSVFKPITVSSALQEGAVQDGDTFYCGGSLFITDTTIKCDNIYGHGEETLEYAIVNSCNVALMQVGQKLGIQKFLQYQTDFGFGSRTGIDLPNETGGVIYGSDSMHEVELATNTFGQGFTCSMIQEAAAFSTVVNGGYYYQPHVVSQILNSDGTVAKTVEPLILRQPISSSVSAYLRRYLNSAVLYGTGRKSQVPGYRTGGKTGTAEKIDPSTGRRWKGKYLVSFIGAAPIDDPQVVIYCVVDEPNVDQQADSSYPQTLFRKIATKVFPYLGLYPTEEVDDNLLATLGITREDTVQGSGKSSTFQCFDDSGVLHNDAYVSRNGEVCDSDGNVIPGVTVDMAAGIVTDAKGNQIEVDLSSITGADTGSGGTDESDAQPEAVDNPDIASPPEDTSDSGDGSSTWSGATVDDDSDAEASG